MTPTRHVSSRVLALFLTALVLLGLSTGFAPQAQAASPSISGVVTELGSGVPLAGVQVRVWTAGDVFVTGTATDANGQYSVSGLADGNYKVRFHTTSGSHKLVYYLNKSSLALATVVSVSSGSTTDVSAVMGLQLSGAITGQDTGLPLSGAVVRAFRENGTVAATATTQSGGTYSFGLAPGTYTLRFNTPSGTHKTEYWDDTPYKSSASPVTLVSGASSGTVANAVLSPADGTIAGTVTDAVSGLPVEGIQVRFYDGGGALVGTTSTSVSGGYSFALAPGSYRIRFLSPTSEHLLEYYDEVTTLAAATPVVVTSNSITTVDESLTPVVPVSGTVTEAVTGTPLAGVRVRVYTSGGTFLTEATTAGDGTYAFTNLGPGNYKVRFNTPSGTHVLEWYDDKPSQVTADVVTLTAGNPATIDAQLTSVNPTVPGAPLSPTMVLSEDPCTTGCGYVDLSWSAPVSDGGSPITSYEVYLDAGGGYYYVGSTAVTSMDDVYCGVPVVDCVFEVYALNSVGWSATSGASNTVTTQNYPSAPLWVAAHIEGGGYVGGFWAPPVDDGGSAITYYDVWVNADGNWRSRSFAASTWISGLYCGQSASCYLVVVANNSLGEGTASAPSNTVNT